MNPIIASALIAAGAALATPLVTQFLSWRAKPVGTAEANFPTLPIRGQWRGIWYYEENGQVHEHSRDTIDIYKVDGFQIRGKGHDPKFDEPYDIEGFVTAANRFALSYRFKKSAKAYVGVVLLELDDSGNRFQGRWSGYTVKCLRSGDVTWERGGSTTQT